MRAAVHTLAFKSRIHVINSLTKTVSSELLIIHRLVLYLYIFVQFIVCIVP